MVPLTPPREPQSAADYVKAFAAALPAGASIASISGRYYAMDRDNRWERVEKAWRAMVLGEGERFPDAQAAIASAYAQNVTDEFILPAAIGGFLGVFDELPAIEQEMAALRPDPVQRARLFRAILAELRHDCQDGPLRELYGEAMAGLGFNAAAGEDFAALAGRHAAIASAAVLPFEQRQPQLAEHYLVSQVFQSRFPLRSPDLLAQYRELACLHLVCRCFMFGLAGHHGGIDEALAIRFHHALSRIVAHSPDYLAQLAPALQRRLDIDVQSLLLLVALRP